ncbi:hypothetical protein BBO99_00000310 [Phytophthora kernoviae]|uniref:PIPK domain-containing protein n=2 Tax=Phytophthora kernoviae TaxID=325452 RepID=A0A3R7FZ23_9STRA|nr:hypothetical protein G195_000806 [Phytophthora kernoviae 00238/432]KAG2532817.1 hypothetical protein JM16_000068 [Phytophthora kernoviae]KAG2533612.1 hypothetical protein JM18_000070 [Phytophthora kernoviae]RLN11130.1 hypothetical protein BBI17_000151 [Phytophthora kernoviae]RLN86045.1 hypothetical protein BBO99_00000310 [Phytophthora kernoviae]
MAHLPPTESDALLRDTDQRSFCTISLSSDPMDKVNKARHKRHVNRKRGRHQTGYLSTCCYYLKALISGPGSCLAVGVGSALLLLGFACTVLAMVQTYSTDEYLFLGAIVSCAFTLVIIACYLMCPTVRVHPNPLIFSKSLVDLLLGAIYLGEYCVTEFSTRSVVLPFRIASITQALLIAGEFWFFAIPIDMVQSITNPFTSYAHNFRVYWFYSVLSGVICGFVLWSLGDAEIECLTTDVQSPDCLKANSENDQRFIWFHHNTDMPGFFWHQWILYHVCVVVYLVFGLACMTYFYDFQPCVFASIRQLYGVNDSEYIYAFRTTINERISEGRSGAFVFNTCDRKYLVKSTTAKEKNVLLRLLPSYLHYLKWNPETLLPRFFGFHAMKMYGQIFYFIVMGNFLSSTEVIHRRYDIKGSWEDRNAPACVLGEKYRCSKCNRFFTFGGALGEPCFLPGEEHYPDITLRDNDLKKRLKLESGTATKLVKQLTRDSNYLASAGIMDYSLLIGTHYSHFTITTEYKRGLSRRKSVELTAHCEDVHEQRRDTEFLYNLGGDQRPINEDDAISDGTRASESSDTSYAGRSCDPSPKQSDRAVYPRSHAYHAHQVSGPSKYFFGLVDILQEWTVAKQVERAYKVHILRKSRNGVSAIPPKPYARRFQRKMKQLFITTAAQPFESFDDDTPIDIPANQV